MKELAEAFKKAQQVQECEKLQEELEQMEISRVWRWSVKVVLSGNQEPRR